MTIEVAAPRRSIDVTLLTGFLGSGKTTLVNHILSADHGRRVAVIVNEFGEIPIDGDLIVSSDEEIMELANGCFCCTVSVRNDLTSVLRKLADRSDSPDHILVESSGMADPMPAAQALFVEDIADRVALDAIVTMVDAKHIDEHLDELGPDSIDGLAVDQIVCADRIVLNKVDLVGEARLDDTEARIRELNNEAGVVRSSYAQVDLDAVLGIGAFDRSQRSTAGDDFLDTSHDVDRNPKLGSVSLEVGGDLDSDALDAWLEALVTERAADVYRLKGILAVAGETQRVILQGVHSIVERYPEGLWKGPRRSRVVVIGRDLDESELRRGLEGARSR